MERRLKIIMVVVAVIILLTAIAVPMALMLGKGKASVVPPPAPSPESPPPPPIDPVRTPALPPAKVPVQIEPKPKARPVPKVVGPTPLNKPLSPLPPTPVFAPKPFAPVPAPKPFAPVPAPKPFAPVPAPTPPAPVPAGSLPVIASPKCSETLDPGGFPWGGKGKGADKVKTSAGLMTVTLPSSKDNNGGNDPWGSNGGFIYRPIKCKGAMEISVSFEVEFPSGFEWVKGGKAGLGFQFGSAKIQGGQWDPNAASVRVMWRPEGAASGYLYYGSSKAGGDMAEQVAGYADVASSTGTAGHSLWQAKKSKDPLPSFKFGWNSVTLYGKMNTAKQHDGVLGISVNGQSRVFSQLKWLDQPTGIDTLEISSWFGGSDQSWAPSKPQTISYRNLKVVAK